MGVNLTKNAIKLHPLSQGSIVTASFCSDDDDDNTVRVLSLNCSAEPSD